MRTALASALVLAGALVVRADPPDYKRAMADATQKMAAKDYRGVAPGSASPRASGLP